MPPSTLKRALVLASILFLISCSQQRTDAPEPAQAAAGSEDGAPAIGADPPQSGPVLVFLGNSLTAGAGLPEDQAFPAVIGGMLRERGLLVRVVNAGVSGDTTAGGLSRLPWVLESGPDVLVVCLGGNDGLRGFPVEVTRRNLRELIGHAKEAGVRVLLLAMEVPTSHGPDYASEFRSIYPDLAMELEVPLVPYFLLGVGGVRDLNQADGIHPTAEGHRVLASNVLPHLLEILAPTASP